MCGPWKKCLKWSKKDSGGSVPTNRDLLFGHVEVHSENSHLGISLGSRFPDIEILGFPDFQIPGSWNQVPGYGWLQLGGRGSEGMAYHDKKK